MLKQIIFLRQKKTYNLNEKGQVILILILVMTVALAIGLSIVQKSLVDVSTASKVEQSSRAFSAAEAGIEEALRSTGNASCSSGGNCQSFTNSSQIKTIADSGLAPCVPGQPSCAQVANTRQAALELPPLAKEDVAQVWLADPAAVLPACGSSVCYTQQTLEVYWGSSTADRAALEVTLIYFDGSQYLSKKWYLDNAAAGRSNGFEQINCQAQVNTIGSNTYTCKRLLGSSPDTTILPTGMMLLRFRLLYNSTSQPVAVWAVGTCGLACSLPPQARTITSTGTSGETQRKVNLFQLNNMVPPYFDYAIFSAGAITK